MILFQRKPRPQGGRLVLVASVSLLFAGVVHSHAGEINRVVGVASNDVLNVRTGPGARFADIGDISPGATVDVIGYAPGRRWAIIMWRGQRAYISARYLQPLGVDEFGNQIGGQSSSGSNTASNGGGNSSSSGGSQPPNCPIPGVFRVVNVASNDRLNLRDAPNTGGAVLGDFGPSENVAVISWGTNGWAQVSSSDRTGFVRNSFLACSSHTTNNVGFPTNLFCYGTEPFWRADIENNGTMTYKGVDQPTSPPAAFQSTNPNTLTGNYPYTFAAVPFSGTINRAVCNDGMSDVTNIWSIQLNAPNGNGGFDTLNGCCRMK